ncbi:MAG: hypothetical protein PUC82_04425 [bacterium]|nr:hypothetical protein [bacterium]
MKLEDQFKLLVLGYYGVRCLDEYDLKVYLLKDIEEYIKSFIEINPIDNYNYLDVALKLEDEPIKVKLQDALIVLHKIKAPIDVVLLVKRRIKMLENSDKV